MTNKIITEGITFDDVLLIPGFSEVLPSNVSLKTSITKNIQLNIPIISAAMDTVTEANMAISIAREGGIGIIHKNMSIEDQALHVQKVKRNENGIIKNPITLLKTNTIEEAKAIMERYKISGLLIVDEKKKLQGILTNRDLRYNKTKNQIIDEIMTKENLITTLDKHISIDVATSLLAKNKVEKLPIVDAQGIVKGLITMKDIKNLSEYPNACKDAEGRLKVGAAVGIGPDSEERISELIKWGVDILVIDSAHGHSKSILELVKATRKKFPKLDIMAGNVVTGEGAKALIDAGVSSVKVGIGPGSICTTRIIAGVGMPQISAVHDVYQMCKKHKVSVIADGGIKFSGDIVKALAAGADAVMVGNLVAGTEESPGDDFIYEGRKFKSYVGMGSISAMKRGSKDRYFQDDIRKLVPEGIEGMVPYKGHLKEVVHQLCGGIRSGMGYCGTATIELLKKNGKFVKITSAGLKESHTHSVTLTKESPNYSKYSH